MNILVNLFTWQRHFGRLAFLASLFLTALAAASFAATTAAPVFSPAGATYATTQTVAMTSTTSGASIRYTTDGSTPSTKTGTLYSGPVAISATITLKALAWTGAGSDKSSVTAATYTIKAGTQAAAPAFSPAGGTYSSAQNVTITSATSGASINYTTDGSMPTPTTGTLYSGPVTVSSNETLTAMAFESGFTNSNVTAASYTISVIINKVADPAFSPVGGTYSSAQNVTIMSATSGVSIRYTTDGSTPSETVGTIYSGPVNVSSSATFMAIAYKSGDTDSAVTGATYTIGSGGGGTVSTPVFSPGAGPFYAATPVTIASATAGVTIRYTVDGSTPTETNGTLYTGPVIMQQAVDTNMTAATASNGSGITMLKAVAYKSGMTDSSVFTGNFIIIVPLRFAKTTSMVLGLAHMAYNVTTANWTGIYNIWTHDIGYAPVQVSGTSPNRFALIKINDQQFIELYEVTSLPSTSVGGHQAQFQLKNYGFYVTDAKAFQAQVQSAGVSITSSASVNALGNLSFFTTDTDGHLDEWVQYLPGSVTSQTLGQNMPGTQLFGYMEDYGDACSNVTAANSYYAKFGFNGRGTKVYLPNNNCYLEMLTFSTPLTQQQAGVHTKAQLTNFRGFTIQQSGAAVVARDPNIPRVVQGSEGGSGFPSHAYYDLYNADGSRIRLIDINY